ncbi:MAG: DUF6106 family protein [Lachnospiraceae bacterium]|nr:DUF6106 family protein [Lachnospiraceae bacterium]
MSESYVEVLVKKENTMIGTLARVVCIALTVSAAFFTLIGGGFLFMIIAVVLGVGTYFVWLNTDVEYEYLYLDKELSIDKIMAKTKRKKIATYDMERLEVLAPANSYHLDDYKNRNFKESDFSSGVKKQPDLRYVMIYDGTQKVYLSEDPRLATMIKTIAPRKVFLD